jgi:hypothetical protein
MTIDEQRRRLGVTQVEALFGSILIATATASATSLFIAAGLISPRICGARKRARLGPLSPRIGRL